MKKTLFFLVLLKCSLIAFAQDEPAPPTPQPTPPPIQRSSDEPPPAKTPPPTPKPTPQMPKASLAVIKNYELNKDVVISREQREEAYHKLLEGQRFIWGAKRLRSQTTVAASIRVARQSFLKAIELNPNLSESYVAIAETFITFEPTDTDEAIAFANLAVKINPKSAGGRRFLAIGYLIKSNLGLRNFNQEFGKKAIDEWNEVAKLDPTKAEAWAYLSQLYGYTNQDELEIFALKNWLAASPLVDFQRLAPTNAVLPLGESYIRRGQYKEAVEVLRQALVDEGEKERIVQLLGQTGIEVDSETANSTIEYLQRALFETPDDVALIELLSIYQSKAGKVKEAANSLRSLIKKFSSNEARKAAELQITLGDIYADNNLMIEAADAYKEALSVYGIANETVATDDERDFSMRVFSKIISIHKNAKNFQKAKESIELSGLLLGKDDLFVTNQLINLYTEFGQKNEALKVIREIRQRYAKVNPANTKLISFDEYTYYRREAILLVELGKVEEGVALMKTLLLGKIDKTSFYNDFDINVFISNLYNQAKRGKQAIESAKQAIALADTNSRKEVGNLVLASALFESGDFESAETILREVIKQTPKNSTAFNNLGSFMTENNVNLNEAFDLIQQAVKLDPTNAMFLDSLGWVNFKLGNYQEAEKNLTEAVRRSPNSTTILDHLGDVYFKLGKFELAKVVWQKAIGLSSDADEIAKIKQKINKNTKKP
ncbi:MAG: tetratricopeptide repeat protein [Pyrinomonadaceae bacterium]|nr:tetratricopeptide repeat protein [Pyrinomonadaceae bacterium]